MTIKDELIMLQEKSHGFLRAQTAVDWARDNPDSALHSALDWDDANAANEHRLWQIRQLIRVNVVDKKGVPQLISLSIDRTEPGGGYRKLDDVLSTPDLRSVLLRDALNELDRVQQKYESISELVQVWEAKDVVKKKRGKEGPAAIT